MEDLLKRLGTMAKEHYGDHKPVDAIIDVTTMKEGNVTITHLKERKLPYCDGSKCESLESAMVVLADYMIAAKHMPLAEGKAYLQQCVESRLRNSVKPWPVRGSNWSISCRTAIYPADSELDIASFTDVAHQTKKTFFGADNAEGS